MHSDPISDMIIRIKNGYSAGLKQVEVSWSKPTENLAKLLVKTGFVTSVDVVQKDQFKEMIIMLKYDGKEPAMAQIRRISKPSLRVYVDKKSLPKVLGGMGVAIVSTPKGLMTDKEARVAGLGGEVWCEVW